MLPVQDGEYLIIKNICNGGQNVLDKFSNMRVSVPVLLIRRTLLELIFLISLSFKYIIQIDC